MSLQIEFGRMECESRIAQGYTQEVIAELADITARYMHDIEYGKSEVGLRTAVVLADILGMDLNLRKQFAVHDKNGFYRKEYDEKGTTEI
ncbi:MAG: helix-turn-helix transcriptional regulator [Lachnospiraceae bacterium]